MKLDKVLIFVVVIIIFLWALSGFAIYFFIDNWNDRGTFGDLFGVINSLFSGLALAGLIYTTYKNKNLMIDQRNEIEINRKELVRSRKIQEKSEKVLEEQARQMSLNTKLNGLKTLVDYFTLQINNPKNSEEIISLARKKRKEAIFEIDKLMNRLGDDDLESLR